MNRIKNIMKHIVDYHTNDINYNNEYEVDMIYRVYINTYMIHDYEWMNDFYEESPNWINNNENKQQTIDWINLSYNEKQDILDIDIDNYFHMTYDGEL